jgi:hypothetical protein
MLQRIAFSVTFLAAVLAAACGRQVTPNPAGLGAGGTPPGYLSVFFSAASPFNFSNYQYVIVFNTTGSGRTPSTDTVQTNWAGYSYAVVARGNGGSSYAQPVHYLDNMNPHIPPYPQILGTTPQTFSYNLNPDGTGTEFQILAQRRIFSSPGPSPSPTPNVWTFNAFVYQQNGSGLWQFYDSLGAGGPIDPQFVSPNLCMTEPFDNTYYGRGFTPPDPAAQITSIEIANNPVSPMPCK